MASHLHLLAYVAAGVLGSAGAFILGTALLIASRGGTLGSALVFWLSETIVSVVVWRVSLSPLIPLTRKGETPGDSTALGGATAVSALAFLGLWVFAVAFSGGKVGLTPLRAFMVASGLLLFLVSIPSRWTRVRYAVRMPLLAACVVAMVAIGFYYMIGRTL